MKDETTHWLDRLAISERTVSVLFVATGALIYGVAYTYSGRPLSVPALLVAFALVLFIWAGRLHGIAERALSDRARAEREIRELLEDYNEERQQWEAERAMVLEGNR
jgi:hypothetical protein